MFIIIIIFHQHCTEFIEKIQPPKMFLSHNIAGCNIVQNLNNTKVSKVKMQFLVFLLYSYTVDSRIKYDIHRARFVGQVLKQTKSMQIFRFLLSIFRSYEPWNDIGIGNKFQTELSLLKRVIWPITKKLKFQSNIKVIGKNFVKKKI